MPREIQPVDFRVGAQAFLPVQLAAEFHPLLGTGGQVKCGDVRPLGIDTTLQRQCHGALLGWQARRANDLVTVQKIALGSQFQRIELQGVRQGRAGLELIRRDFYLGGQVFRQRL